MRVRTKLLSLCLVIIPLSGCASHSSLNGRETWGIGLFQIREGKGDTNYAWGSPADESTQTHARASEIVDGPSASIQTAYRKEGR